MRLELVRHAYLSEYTLGTLITPDMSMATIERPWIPHEDGPGGWIRKSCVQDGSYTVEPHDSEDFPNTFALVNEDLGVYHYSKPAGQSWGRTAILIHRGNWVKNVVGCIAVGRSHGRLENERAVISSTSAMNILREILGREAHELVIRPTNGTAE